MATAGYTSINGAEFSDAMLEAAAIAPTYSPHVDTFEIYHPSLSAPLYVAMNPNPFSGRIESTATRNAGNFVDFIGTYAESDHAEESERGERQEMEIRIPNISGDIATAIRAARGSLVQWEIIKRTYITSDPGKPALLPVLPLYILSYELDVNVALFRAGYGDPSNVSVPAVSFRRVEHSTLAL